MNIAEAKQYLLAYSTIVKHTCPGDVMAVKFIEALDIVILHDFNLEAQNALLKIQTAARKK